MPIQPDSYTSTIDLVNEIKRIRASQPHAKIAFCFTGGGARGAYEAGALEGLFAAAHALGVNIEPDILAGASVGSVIAFMHWAGRMLPKPLAPPYVTAQSSVWQHMANGNSAGETLFKGGWIVPYATGKSPIPLLTDLFKKAQAVQGSWRNLQGDLKAVKRDLPAGGDAIRNAVQTVAANALLTDFLNAARDAVSYFSAAGNSDAQNKAQAAVMNDATKLGNDLINNEQAVHQAIDSLGLICRDLPGLVDRLDKVAGDVGTILRDATTFVQNAAALDADVTLLLGVIDLVLGLLSILFVGGTVALTLADTSVAVGAGTLVVPAATALAGNSGQTPAPPQLAKSLLGMDGLQRLLAASLTSQGMNNATAFMGPDDFVAAWKKQPDRAPELYLVGANISRSRATVFAVAPDAALQALASKDFMTVDLAGSGTSRGDNLYTLDRAADRDNLIRATTTSSSIPFAFPFQTWTLHPANGSAAIAQDIVDGGLIDNTPIDVARAAGATHIVSFELQPLLRSTTLQCGTGVAHNMLDVLWQSFQTAMDASLRSRILEVVNANVAAPASAVPVYRLAPLVDDRLQSPSTMDFDGKYDAANALQCNLEDWFVQGYRDAKQLDATSMQLAAQHDAVFQQYVARATNANGKSGAALAVDFGRRNAFYCAVKQAYPVASP